MNNFVTPWTCMVAIFIMIETPPSDDVCPICYNNFNLPCITNCGHWFCGNCILLCWKHRPSIKQCKCPVCTQPVSKLIPEASAFSNPSEEAVEIYKNIQQYNRLYGGGTRLQLLLQILRDFPLYLRKIQQQLLDIDGYYANFQQLRFIILIFGLVCKLSLLYKLSCMGSLATGDVYLMIRFMNFHNWIDIGSYFILTILFIIGAWREQAISNNSN